VDVVSLGEEGQVRLNTVAGTPPAGLCGSGLIDLVAEMLRLGLVTASGYMRRPDELEPESAAARYRDRLVRVDAQQAFHVAPEPGCSEGAEVVLTARDVREIQLAKGSIVTAMYLACQHLGLDVMDLEEVLVAGAFGQHVRKASALAIGLVPPVDARRIEMVGNAAGVGARLALLDRDVRQRARQLAERAEYVDLATRPDYQRTFMEMLSFPPAG
jgi:uncharacterized 2Fe-2S/4Fe-4S cluster protein (DUF4445 family)